MMRWPAGAVVTQAWLSGQGLPSREAARYAERGGLQRVGHGAYARPGDKLTWAGGMHGLQLSETAETVSFWPGGLTALAQAGYRHYIPMGKDTLHLYGRPNARLASWFTDYNWQLAVEVNRIILLNAWLANSFTYQAPSGRDFSLYISTPERATLEWLQVTPNEQLFSDQVIHTFEGLLNLRPRLLQSLLEQCRSVRVKRVLLLLARNAGHAWFKRLDLSRVDLGRGKRQLVKGGKLDAQFGITVPRALANGA